MNHEDLRALRGFFKYNAEALGEQRSFCKTNDEMDVKNIICITVFFNQPHSSCPANAAISVFDTLALTVEDMVNKPHDSAVLAQGPIGRIHCYEFEDIGHLNDAGAPFNLHHHRLRELRDHFSAVTQNRDYILICHDQDRQKRFWDGIDLQPGQGGRERLVLNLSQVAKSCLRVSYEAQKLQTIFQNLDLPWESARPGSGHKAKCIMHAFLKAVAKDCAKSTSLTDLSVSLVQQRITYTLERIEYESRSRMSLGDPLPFSPPALVNKNPETGGWDATEPLSRVLSVLPQANGPARFGEQNATAWIADRFCRRCIAGRGLT